jgi:hypothetical protein
MPYGPYTQEEIDDALTALIAYAGNATAACQYLKAEGMRAPASSTLAAWSRTRYWERYEELREKVSQGRENTLANNYLDAAHAATEVAMMAVEAARGRLESGRDEDPGRTAANLARVAQSATDKRLSLQGRPTQITETRDLGAILRSLAAKGIIEIPDEPAQLVEASDER